VLDSPLDSVKAESNGGLLGLGIPGTNVWTVTGYKGGQQVVVISEDCGTGGNKAKFQRFCDYSANKGYYLTKSQIDYLSETLSLSATEAFNIAKTICGAVG
jgi:hypothetical protein